MEWLAIPALAAWFLLGYHGYRLHISKSGTKRDYVLLFTALILGPVALALKDNQRKDA